MKSIAQWQNALKKAADSKFPDNVSQTFDRISSIQEQLDDLTIALAVEKGVHISNDHAHQDPDHRIAALIADVLIFAEERNVDIESELEKVLAWFEGRR